ncbi:hypothetical protein TEA_009391 [Camellia sinensis var. sinensis]|uniref:Mechanosensitive ion channel protein n=1 Tax=Camellia sinensis var. sinensis TaxID=542762 RepID=A0A4S4D1J7_CAMSN|nr:hypothetical protein TEA_009391 [Camellia sinensis var. sinensis]
MAQQFPDSIDHDDVALKIADESGDNFDLLKQTHDPIPRRTIKFSEIQDDDDDDDADDDDEDDDDDSVPGKARMFMSRSKSRLEDRHCRYKRLSTTDKDCKEDDLFLDEDEDIFGEFDWKDALTIVQWVSLLLILVTLACTLTISHLKNRKLWELYLWNWEILILVLICGHLVSGWMIRALVFFIECNFILKIRVLYFVYGLRKSIQNFLWLGQVLSVWHFILAEEIGRVTKHGVLRYVTKILVCLWVGALIWLFKTLVVKVLASSFHVTAFFNQIRCSLFKQYVIKKLSGSPLAQEQSEPEMKNPKLSRRVSKRQDKKITIEHLEKMDQKNVSPLRMKRLMRVVQNGSLSTLDEELPSSTDEDEASLRIKDEKSAKAAAKKIFRNVVDARSKYIYLDDLMRFMSKDQALKTMDLFKGSNENKGINLESLTKWMVDAFKERRSLALSLDDTKTAVDELHNILNVIVTIIIVIIWLFIFDIAISHFLVLVGSQLLLAVFIFGDTCKRIFEAITFLFVMHPFDVGDRCEVDGVQMVVEEMNILTTVFLRYDNQMIIYPNSVLATKPISNYFRSPDMLDSVEFSIHISTPMEKIASMRKSIISYIDERSDHWHEAPTVLITDVEDMNRVKMVVWVKHRMNFQHMGERWVRRALLVEKMIKVFRELDIEYHLANRTLPPPPLSTTSAVAPASTPLNLAVSMLFFIYSSLVGTTDIYRSTRLIVSTPITAVSVSDLISLALSLSDLRSATMP